MTTRYMDITKHADYAPIANKNPSDMSKFPTVKQARNKIDKGETIEQNKELEYIKNLIIQEIGKGNCSVYLSNKSILNSTGVFLENNGYKIETGGRYNEINTIISW